MSGDSGGGAVWRNIPFKICLTYNMIADRLGIMSRIMRLWIGVFALCAGCVALAVGSLAHTIEGLQPMLARMAAPPVAWHSVAMEEETIPIRRGDTLDGLLERAGVGQPERFEMVKTIEGSFDVRKFRAGTELTLKRWPEGRLEAFEYAIDPDHKLQLARSEEGFQASVIEIPGFIREALVCGVIQDSLFMSMQRTGESPELAIQMAEIFAWDLDFYTDPQPGDEFCLVVEKKEYLNGQPATYRRVLAAKYVNQGTPYDGYLFEDETGEQQYYSHDGNSLRAAFLRSPLEFNARISSRFSYRRFHPVLKRYRPHLGVDYAAPTGAPVRAVASGRVTFSGRSGGSGNLIKIRHANGFETMYLHLSRRLVKKGQRVTQGQRIGLVGSTGLSTGPHLDFRIRKNGKYMNFAKMKPPKRSKIPAAEMAAFAQSRDPLARRMQLRGGPVLAVNDPHRMAAGDD